jgi:membrane-bound serine protease (ClpP class)
LGASANLPAAEGQKRVYILPIRADIDSPLVYLVRRGVKEAIEAKADLLILDMETNGGRIDKTEEIIDILGKFKGETVTYVNDRAFSAGAFISVATQKIFMKPASVIGAAAPVMAAPGGGIQDVPSTMKAKITSAVRALVRKTAEKNGYNLDVIEAMIDDTKELTIDGKVLNKKGEILTLTDTEAAAEYGNPPKPLLSSGTVESLDALIDKLGYKGAQVTAIKETGAEKLGSWLNTISPILLIIGMVGIYIEFKTPGVIVPGIVGVIAFLLYFVGLHVAALSGMEWVIVFVIGLALVISEFFVHPGVVIPGIIGAILILVSLVMAMVDMYPGMPAMPDFSQLVVPLRNVMIAIIISVVIMMLLATVLPQTSLYRPLISTSASGVISEKQSLVDQALRVGQKGVAISNLRPGGKAQFGNDIIDVITQGEMIAKGQGVRIIGHSGTDAIVENAA